jgi:hypothetical protein
MPTPVTGYACALPRMMLTRRSSVSANAHVGWFQGVCVPVGRLRAAGLTARQPGRPVRIRAARPCQVAPCLTIRPQEGIPLIRSVGEVTAVAPPLRSTRRQNRTLPRRATHYPVSIRV